MRLIINTILFIILLAGLRVVYQDILQETKAERFERINMMANRECPKYEDRMARMCFDSYYKAIEIRN